MAGFMAQPPPAAVMEAELFSSSHRQQSGNGISGRSILFTGSPTEVFLTVRYSALVRVKSMGPPITVAKTGSALFTNCLPDLLGNGMGEGFIASKPEATATVRS